MGAVFLWLVLAGVAVTLVEGVENAALGSTYWGELTKAKASVSLKLTLENSHKGELTEAGRSHTISIKQNGDNLEINDVQGSFSLKGINLDNQTIIGAVFEKNKQTGKFTLKPGVAPLKPFKASPFGRRFFVYTCCAFGGMALLYMCAVRHSNHFVRMYIHKTIGSAVTLVVGQMIAKAATGLFYAFPPHIPNFAVQALILFCVFVVGWFLFTYVGWRHQEKKLYRSLLGMLGTDILGFLGFYAFDAFWKCFASNLPGYDILCALAVWAISVIVLLALWKTTEMLRGGRLKYEPQSLTNERQRKAEERAARADAAGGGGGGFGRACTMPAMPGITGAFQSAWATIRNSARPASPEASPDASPEVTPPATESVNSNFGQVQKNDHWQYDVLLAELTTISIIEAFLVFKIVELIVQRWNSWIGTAIAFGIVIALVIVAVKMTKDQGVSQFEHIFTATLARIIGLCMLSVVAWLVSLCTDNAYIITPMVTLFFCFLIVVLFISAIAWRLAREDATQIGLLSPSSGQDPYKQGDTRDKYASRDPQEIAGMGLMLALAAVDVIETIFAEVVAMNSFANKFPIMSKVILAIVLTIILVFFWYSIVLPEAAKTHDDHVKEIEEENGMEQEANDENTDRLLG